MAWEFTGAVGVGQGAGDDPGARPGRAAPLPRTVEAGAPEEPSRDLRRKESRSLTELLLARSESLGRRERELVKLVYGDAKRATEAAAVLGVPARKVRRWLKELAERLVSARFEFVARERAGWPSTRRKVATLVYLHGRSLREACEELGLSVYVVRRHCDVVDGMFEAAEAGKSAG